MRYEARPPRVGLEPFVRCLWRLRGASHEIEPQPIVPDGCFELIVHLGEPLLETAVENAGDRAVYAAGDRETAPAANRQGRALLAATLTRTVVVAASGDVDVIGIRFNPGRAYPFLAVAPWEIVDRVAPAHDVIARELVGLTSRLEPGRTEDLFGTVEQALLTRLERAGSDGRFDRMASALVAVDGPAVTRIADGAGISLRQFERLFKSRAGVSAKVLQRVVRFHRVASRLLDDARADAPDLATLALDGGFSDQAHMSHEFRALADVTPSRYPRQAGTLDRLFAEL